MTISFLYGKMHNFKTFLFQSQTDICAIQPRAEVAQSYSGTDPIIQRDHSTQLAPKLVDRACSPIQWDITHTGTSPHTKWVDYSMTPLYPESEVDSWSDTESEEILEEYHTHKGGSDTRPAASASTITDSKPEVPVIHPTAAMYEVDMGLFTRVMCQRLDNTSK